KPRENTIFRTQFGQSSYAAVTNRGYIADRGYSGGPVVCQVFADAVSPRRLLRFAHLPHRASRAGDAAAPRRQAGDGSAWIFAGRPRAGRRRGRGSRRGVRSSPPPPQGSHLAPRWGRKPPDPRGSCPISSKICSLADSFWQQRTDRPQRNRWPSALVSALSEISPAWADCHPQVLMPQVRLPVFFDSGLRSVFDSGLRSGISLPFRRTFRGALSCKNSFMAFTAFRTTSFSRTRTFSTDWRGGKIRWRCSSPARTRASTPTC